MRILEYLVNNAPWPIAFMTWFFMVIVYVFVLNPIESLFTARCRC